MKKVLLLGAGLVAKPLVDYLLDNNFYLTIASRTKSKAEKLVRGKTNGKAISWTTDDLKTLNTMISGHDLIISLLPYAHHISVAKLCIENKKHLLQLRTFRKR